MCEREKSRGERFFRFFYLAKKKWARWEGLKLFFVKTGSVSLERVKKGLAGPEKRQKRQKGGKNRENREKSTLKKGHDRAAETVAADPKKGPFLGFFGCFWTPFVYPCSPDRVNWLFEKVDFLCFFAWRWFFLVCTWKKIFFACVWKRKWLAPLFMSGLSDYKSKRWSATNRRHDLEVNGQG